MSDVLNKASQLHDVLAEADLPPGGQYVWQHGLDRVLVCRSLDGQVYAMRDLCPHARQPLAGGTVDGVAITCPKHGARFDLRTGDPLNAVCQRALSMLELRIESGRIQILLPTS